MQTTTGGPAQGPQGGHPRKPWMTVAQFADEFQFDTDTVYDLCNTGQLRGAEKIGTRWRISRAAWEATPSATNGVTSAAATAEVTDRSNR